MMIDIDWVLLFRYERKEHAVYLKFSNPFAEQHNLSCLEIKLVGDDILQYLHKYDYRKLRYFSEQNQIKNFDTQMRFTLESSQQLVRTRAICQINQKGFSCVNFEEVRIIKLKDEIDPLVSISKHSFKIDTSAIHGKNQLLFSNMRLQLAKLVARELKNRSI